MSCSQVTVVRVLYSHTYYDFEISAFSILIQESPYTTRSGCTCIMFRLVNFIIALIINVIEILLDLIIGHTNTCSH